MDVHDVDTDRDLDTDINIDQSWPLDERIA